MEKPTRVKLSFETNLVTLPITSIVPLKEVSPLLRTTTKYKQIVSSLRHVGLIEPVVVFPRESGRYWLLDGHLRLEILKEIGAAEVKCLLATDDESYNYNKRVNSLPAIAEHQMILKAITNGVPEERIAEALNVDVASIRKKRNLLDGICSEAADLLKDKRIVADALGVLKKMKPVRQVEAAELMIASNSYSLPFAKALLSVTSTEFLNEPPNARKSKPLLPHQTAIMEEETRTLLKDLRAAEESYGTDILNLTVACRYLEGLLRKRAVRKYLAKQHSEILKEIDQLLGEVEIDRSNRRAEIYGVKIRNGKAPVGNRKAG